MTLVKVLGQLWKLNDKIIKCEVLLKILIY